MKTKSLLLLRVENIPPGRNELSELLRDGSSPKNSGVAAFGFLLYLLFGQLGLAFTEILALLN
jgi:hypothetical protein